MKLLMCAPDFFRIEYEINPWMKIGNNADSAQVSEQYATLQKAFSQTGIQIEEFKPDTRYPDMVYTANYAVVQDRTVVIANFRYPQRQGESELAEDYFRSQNYEVHRLPQDIFFEGEGDFLRCGNRWFLGYGKRSMKEAGPLLSKILGKEVIPLELVDPYFYHLDTCFAPLSEDTILINPASFTEEGLAEIKKYFKNIITTEPEDNKIMACNLICYNKTIISGKGFGEKLKASLNAHGYSLLEVSMSQYIKGGGSVKCCSLILEL